MRKQTKGNYPYIYLNKQNMFNNNNNQEREDHQLSSVPLTHHH